MKLDAHHRLDYPFRKFLYLIVETQKCEIHLSTLSDLQVNDKSKLPPFATAVWYT